MTGEDSPRQELENPYHIPPKEAPVTKDPKTADKKPGSDWLGVVYMIIGLFILIAAFQLYFTIQDLIRTWVSDQFVPVISAVYYLVVIIVGIWLLREYIRRQ
jgi:uncharacterized membrane protein